MAIEDKLILEKGEAALVVIDVVKDICANGFCYYKKWKISDILPLQSAVDEKILPLIERSKGKLPMVYVKSAYTPKQFENDTYSITDFCIGGSEGSQFYKLNEADAALVHTKHHWSAFMEKNGYSKLRLYLLEEGINKVILTGLTSTHCIPANVDDAIKTGLEVVVLRDCIAARSERLEHHLANIKKFEEDPRIVVLESSGLIYK